MCRLRFLSWRGNCNIVEIQEEENGGAEKKARLRNQTFYADFDMPGRTYDEINLLTQPQMKPCYYANHDHFLLFA